MTDDENPNLCRNCGCSHGVNLGAEIERLTKQRDALLEYAKAEESDDRGGWPNPLKAQRRAALKLCQEAGK